MAGPADNRVRVLVADDHPVFRDGVIRALTSSGEIEVVATAADGSTALDLIRTHRPDVALLDYRMPGIDGAQVAAEVLRDGLLTRVLLLSAHDQPEIVYRALQLGAAGFLPKDADGTDIVEAVLDCAHGRDVLSPALAAGLATEIRRQADAPAGVSLSAREHEVLRRIATGQSVASIAADLFLAPSTIKTHVQRLYEKLGVKDRASAVAEAMRRGLLD